MSDAKRFKVLTALVIMPRLQLIEIIMDITDDVVTAHEKIGKVLLLCGETDCDAALKKINRILLGDEK